MDSRGAAAAQDHGVAALERQTGDVHGDVGARLVDRGDHAHRHVDLAQAQPVREGLAADHVAHRVGQVGEVFQRGGQALHPGIVEGEAVQQRRGGAVGPAGGDVLGVGGQDPVLVLQQCGADGAQPAVLPGPVGAGHPAGGSPGAVGDGVHGGFDVRRGRRQAPRRARREPARSGCEVRASVMLQV